MYSFYSGYDERKAEMLRIPFQLSLWAGHDIPKKEALMKKMILVFNWWD